MADPLLTHRALDALLEPLLEAPRWLVGLSGGLDSTVLLQLLSDWCQHNAAPPLHAIHVNHALQADADNWQLHCQRLCESLQIPLLSPRAEVVARGRGPEDAAREARYGLFERELRDGEILFLGHHADDQVETFLLRLLRGAGVQGLAAMPVTRALGRGTLVRPLLQQPRSRLEHYAAARRLAWIEDPSNSDTAINRNYLRETVLPVLAARWPGYRQTVGRASAHIASAAEQLAEAAPAPPTVYSAMGDPGVALATLVSCSPREAALVLRHWLRAAGLPTPDQAALDEFLRQLGGAAVSGRPRLQCSAYTLQRYREGVYLLPGFQEEAGGDVSLSLAAGGNLELPGGGRLSLAPSQAEGLRLAPGESVQVSWRRGGERCCPQGRGGSASLKKLLQEWAIPPWWRDRIPLLVLEGELLAVGDLWLCDSGRWAAAAGPGEDLWRPRWERNFTAAFD